MSKASLHTNGERKTISEDVEQCIQTISGNIKVVSIGYGKQNGGSSKN
jgi:hypothetical protein